MTNNADMTKLSNAAIKMIEETLASGKTMCLFDQHKLLASLRVATLKIRHMHSELSDILTGSVICRKYGEWVTGEHESDVRYLVRLTEPKQDITEVSVFIKHDAPPRAERPRVFSLEVPRGITEEQAQAFLNQAVATYRNTGNVADLHDEDIRRQNEL